LKILRLQELTRAGKTVPSLETLQLEPAQRERLLKQLLADLGTNQTLVVQAAAGLPDTSGATSLATNLPAGPAGPAPAAKAPGRTTPPGFSAADSKGATALMLAAPKTGAPGTKSASKHRLPTASDGTPLTVGQIEARLVAALEVSEDDRRALIKQRAQAVQAAILKTGKVAADRLFIVTPKPARANAKGECRVNLSLN
jgi:hypothetical protein